MSRRSVFKVDGSAEAKLAFFAQNRVFNIKSSNNLSTNHQSKSDVAFLGPTVFVMGPSEPVSSISEPVSSPSESVLSETASSPTEPLLGPERLTWVQRAYVVLLRISLRSLIPCLWHLKACLELIGACHEPIETCFKLLEGFLEPLSPFHGPKRANIVVHRASLKPPCI